jgi:N-acetyl sugar amidotransferase
MSRPYQICTRCIMDTSDPDIEFDDQGVCNHCQKYDRMVKRHVFTGEAGQEKLKQLVSKIRRSGTKKKYDCIIGVSGGVDSTYVAYRVKQMGLRPLAIHLDNGWDSELSVKNIEMTLKLLGIDLYTHVLDWEEFKDLQLSFLKASTPDSEIPTDHGVFALLFQMAKKLGVKYIITGMNVRTESHLPIAWSQGHNDWKYISSIHKQFGTVPLKTFPRYSFLTFLYYRLTLNWIDILDYIDYSKKNTIPILEKEIGWKYYGGKHYESIYTRFYQGYILPKKFGFDKRRTHLSSLICSGEITRSEALDSLKEPTYDRALQEEDYTYVVKKFGLTTDEFERIMNQPRKAYKDYPSIGWIYKTWVFKLLRYIYRLVTERERKS